ncbi:MAG TPA: ComEA family DNA-binding protein [Candidatus Limnocylindrales bacterium]|nr:ComEA family DNA-binding protein [Candidatus Limnocylindrales bacterium]
MDRSAAPWRVLEEQVSDGVAGAADGSPGRGAAGAPLAGLGWGTLAAIAVAAVLAVAAFLIAATGPGGTVAVDTADGGSGFAGPGSADPGGGTPAGTEIVVDVQGAVVKPGVLHLPAGSRVGDAIASAGGYGPRVDAERAGRELNLAATLKDGDRVVVPSRDDPPATVGGGGGGGEGGSGRETGGLVDLNSATTSELDALPGVGPVTAQKIIDARAEQPFASVEDLRDRKIVGASAFERLRELVTVR